MCNQLNKSKQELITEMPHITSDACTATCIYWKHDNTFRIDPDGSFEVFCLFASGSSVQIFFLSCFILSFSAVSGQQPFLNLCLSCSFQVPYHKKYTQKSTIKTNNILPNDYYCISHTITHNSISYLVFQRREFVHQTYTYSSVLIGSGVHLKLQHSCMHCCHNLCCSIFVNCPLCTAVVVATENFSGSSKVWTDSLLAGDI